MLDPGVLNLNHGAIELFPLTNGQKGIWIAQALDRRNVAYNIAEYSDILGEIDKVAFESAIRSGVEDTASFALAFVETEEGPAQYFAPNLPWKLKFLDFSATPDPQKAALAWMREDMAIPLDIYLGRPFRFALLRLASRRHWFYTVIHHIVSDGIGGRLVVRRWVQRYRDLLAGAETGVANLNSIPEILADENAYRSSSRFARDREYCLQQTSGPPSPLLAAAAVEPADTSNEATVALDSDLDLASFGRMNEASAAAVFLSAVVAYIYRQTNQTDLLIGLQTSTRLGREMRNAVGPTTNTTPVRVTFHPTDSFADLVRIVASKMREALRRQQYRIEDLRRDLGLSPNEPNPFSAVVNIIPPDEPISFTDQPCRRHWLGNWRVDDIMFALYDGGTADAHRIQVVANAAKYTDSVVQLHCERLCNLLSAAVRAPETPCNALDRMTPSERRQVLLDFNRASSDMSQDEYVHRLFELRAHEHPDRPALKAGDVGWSYGQLNAAANKLARYLKANGAGPEAPIVLCMERSAEMVLAIIAALKVGAAYVPVDPRQPGERIALVLRDTQALIVLTSQQSRAQIPDSQAKIVILDDQQLDLISYSAADFDEAESALTPDRLAYVIYTSGSTGIPKGVMIEHRSLTHRLLWMQRQHALSTDDCILLKMPITFDAAALELIWPLIAGARVIVASPLGHLDPEYIARVILDEGVTTALFVPSMLSAFLDQARGNRYASLRRIICGGEELSAARAQQCMRLLPQVQLFNSYGPTEATIHVTHWSCAPGQAGLRVPIGRPIDDVQVYILDDKREPVAIGALGEIYLAGVGLARGYLNRPELDAELFVACPFGEDPAARMYKTGDLGLWRSDGAIEFHGRNDDQVKIRGVRIELGEIETQLTSLPGVRAAAVVVERGVANEQKLVAFFVVDPLSDADADADANVATALRRRLSRRLPEHMVPAAFIRLQALPLTANGKLDRAALVNLAAAPTGEAASEPQALETATELALAEIWRDLLGRDDFGRMDDFYDLGGHSLLATQMRSRIRSRLAVELPLKLMFENRRLSDLAKAVDDALVDQKNRKRQRIEPTPETDAYVLSHSQQRMWLNQALDPESTAYNLAGALKLRGALNVDALSQAFDALRRRHETLRSVFLDTPEGVRQRVLPFCSQPLQATDLRPLAEKAFAEALRLAEQDARTPFNLVTGPVLRVLLFRIGDEEHLLYIGLHHISGDQWSGGILSRELSALYDAYCARRTPELEPLPVQYRDYAIWRRSDQQIESAQADLAYWRQKLDGVTVLDLPTDFPRPKLRTSSGAFLVVPLPMELITRLERVSSREGATLFMTMLAAFAVLLHRLTGQTDIAVGAPVANRTYGEIEPLIGTFVNTLVLRLDISGRPTFREFLQRTRGATLEAYSHQDVSFDELVQLVARTRDDGRPPLAQVMFNMLNAPSFSVSLDRITAEPIVIDRGGAQFEVSVSVDPTVMNAIFFEYNVDLFKRSTIERFAAQYMQLLESVSAEATRLVSQANLLPTAEARLLLMEWNATHTPPPPEATFIRMFESQAFLRPDAEALRFENLAISYRELNQQAEGIAGHLRARGVRPGVGVGVCLPRTPLLVAALLGVQKAGGHYIPLDPQTPRKRLEYMLADSGLAVLIAEAEIAHTLSAERDIARLDPQALSSPPPESGDRLTSGEDDLAYIIYTSGTTGQPKGVRVTQRGLANFLVAMRRRPGMTERDAIVAVTTISFDISGLELYLPLSVGARIVLAPTEVATDGEALARLLSDSGATVLQATPATWRMLLDAGWMGGKALRALCGGEALYADLARELLPRVAELWNLYGPTETTIWSTAARVEANSPISIGAPIDNTRVYIVDGEGQICPIGIAGEIWIAGDGVAQGYQNKPELTRERFVRDPFGGADQRLYKTGDIGVWGDDGRLYHLGRSDNQLKVRGFRIEAEEVETLLRSHPAVREAIVVARSAAEEDTRLVGYLIAQSGHGLPTTSELRAFMRDLAPDYMTPSLFVQLDEAPLTTSGKIDRNALPNPFTNHTGPATSYEAPAPGAEQMLADIWREVLKVGTVGANDNFFELGGHSLLALRVAALVRTKTGRRLDPRTLYFQTLRQIATATDLIEAES